MSIKNTSPAAEPVSDRMFCMRAMQLEDTQLTHEFFQLQPEILHNCEVGEYSALAMRFYYGMM